MLQQRLHQVGDELEALRLEEQRLRKRDQRQQRRAALGGFTEWEKEVALAMWSQSPTADAAVDFLGAVSEKRLHRQRKTRPSLADIKRLLEDWIVSMPEEDVTELESEASPRRRRVVDEAQKRVL